MLICVDCGTLFEQARTIVERHGLDTPPYEELRACPLLLCYQRSVPTFRCDLCGEWITGELHQNAGRRPHLRRVPYPTGCQR